MFISTVAPWGAQCSVDLRRSVILYLTLMNDVGMCIGGHILNDFIIWDNGSVQLLKKV